MKHSWILIVIALLTFQCSIDRTILSLNSHDFEILDSFQKMDANHQIQISPEGEPGQNLNLCLTFIDKTTGIALSNQPVHFYHTSLTGKYEPSNPADESTARLNGSANTDSLGRIFAKSILPGDYGSSSDNRHIHMSVFGAHPEAYDIHFKQYTSFIGKRFSKKSEQHFLADLKLGNDSTLIGFLSIEVKGLKNP